MLVEARFLKTFYYIIFHCHLVSLYSHLPPHPLATITKVLSVSVSSFFFLVQGVEELSKKIFLRPFLMSNFFMNMGI